MEDRSKRRARLFTIIGVILALAAGGGTYLVATSTQTAAPPPEQRGPVVVAVRDLQARQEVRAADVAVASYPVSLIPPAALTTTEAVVGRIVTTPVARGEPFLPAKFVAVGTAPFVVLPAGHELEPTSPHFRAMSISVPDSNAVGGNLRAGDMVDILVTVNIDPARFFLPAPPEPPDPLRVPDFSSKVILEHVPILAREGSVYTIRITDLATAEQLAYLQASGGQIALLLRAPDDERLPPTAGAAFENVFQVFGFPTTTRLEAPE